MEHKGSHKRKFWKKSKRNQNVYQAMAGKLSNLVIKVSPFGIQSKVNNFTKKYRWGFLVVVHLNGNNLTKEVIEKEATEKTALLREANQNDKELLQLMKPFIEKASKK